MKPLVVSLAIASVFLSAISTQAERTVLQGGGLAEMRMIYLHQHLPQYLIPCRTNIQKCGMSEAEGEDLTKILTAAQASSSENLILDADFSGAKVFQTERSVGAPIRVSVEALYDEGEIQVAKSTAELAAILLAAYWWQVSEQPKDFLLARSSEITSLFQTNGTEFKISDRFSISVHQQSIQFGEVVELLLAIEDSEKTFEFSNRLALAIGCEDGSEPKDISLENWRQSLHGSPDEKNITTFADLSFQCDQTRIYQILVLKFLIEDAGTVRSDSLKISVRDSF